MGDSNSNINAYALWIDFSNVPIGEVDSVKESNIQIKYTFDLLDGNGANTGLYDADVAAGLASEDRVAYLVSTVDGSITQVTNNTVWTGGIEIPAGFVGYLVVEIDNPIDGYNFTKVKFFYK